MWQQGGTRTGYETYITTPIYEGLILHTLSPSALSDLFLLTLRNPNAHEQRTDNGAT